MPSILIVCTANICRSPMAEALLKRLVNKRSDADEWHIESAGTWAQNGVSAALLSQFVMEDMGMNIADHRSKRVTRPLLRHSDLVLTMERQQKEGLILQFEPFADRIYMLSEMVGKIEDVPDPIGSEFEYFKATAILIESYLSDGFEKINQLARKRDTFIPA
jgi:protein arginine phosphatase